MKEWPFTPPPPNGPDGRSLNRVYVKASPYITASGAALRAALAHRPDQCPACGSTDTGVLTSRRTRGPRNRRRSCLACAARWTTNEVAVRTINVVRELALGEHYLRRYALVLLTLLLHRRRGGQ